MALVRAASVACRLPSQVGRRLSVKSEPVRYHRSVGHRRWLAERPQPPRWRSGRHPFLPWVADRLAVWLVVRVCRQAGRQCHRVGCLPPPLECGHQDKKVVDAPAVRWVAGCAPHQWCRVRCLADTHARAALVKHSPVLLVWVVCAPDGVPDHQQSPCRVCPVGREHRPCCVKRRVVAACRMVVMSGRTMRTAGGLTRTAAPCA